MFFFLHSISLFAQNNGGGGGAGGGGDLIWTIIFPAVLIFFLFQLFFTQSPQKREQKHIEQLKSTLKKNDPVVTAGGIIGTVANISADKNEVTIKVDDNTRIRVLMRSVSPMPKDGGKEGKTETPPAETKKT